MIKQIYTADGSVKSLETRVAPRPGRCRYCGTDINHREDTIVRTEYPEGSGKFTWLHERCTSDYLQSEEWIKLSKAATDVRQGEAGNGDHEGPSPESKAEGKAEGQGPQDAPQGDPADGPGRSSDDILQAVKDALEGKSDKALQEQIDEQAKAIEQLMQQIENPAPKKIEIKTPQGVRQVDDALHPKTEEIIKLLSIDEPVLLIGPTGSGKTHTAEWIAHEVFGDNAEHYGMTPRSPSERFGFFPCSGGMSESHLFGGFRPLPPTGGFAYTPARFIEVYRNGGLFLLDEMDAGDSNVFVKFNAAISNGWMAIDDPNEPIVKMHPEFRLVAAANTWGRGADRQYCGRTPLDASTLDRFLCGTIHFEYDSELEAKLCPVDEVRDLLNSVRDRIYESRIERVVSTRTFVKFDKMYRNGWSVSDLYDKITLGWRKDELAKVADLKK
jgi:MoxR-like ATPase